MAFCKNHSSLYFDNLRRAEKAETVLCLIHASYQAQLKNGDKKDIVRMLKNAYELFRFSSGTYSGESMEQFASQYTIGHELGIWVNSELKLCPLAEKVAKNEITIKDYFDIVFLNLIQPIDGKICHLLLLTLEYAKNKNITSITKKDLDSVFSFASKHDENNINGLFNMFIGSNYFTKVDDNTLKINYPVDHILECCNRECLDVSLDELNNKFADLKTFTNYLTEDHRSLTLVKDRYLVDKKDNITTKESTSSESFNGYNKIFYGIPGCGKSYHVENFELDGVDKENDVIRTTFYLDYANSDFIGQLYPHVDDEGHVTYTHIPGPFTEALERAFKNKDKMIYLVIEEINRGNAAAIFGDVFQLLDRLKEDRDGRHVGDSEYPVSNAFIEDYFKKNNVEFTPGQIYIPRNLTIFATMNTSDQNVFPLDTAFKRRWDREMVTADWDKVTFRNKFVPCTNITWEKFATIINKEILKQNDDSDVSISEDKQIGAFFVRESMLSEVEKEGTREQLIPFVTNVIDYLYNDVTKFDHKVLFRKDITSYDSLYEKMETYIKSYDKNTNDSGCGPLELLFNDELIEILKNSEDE